MRTTYDGPTQISTLAFSGRTIRLVRPGEPDRMLDEPGVRALNAASDYMPYWAYLWPGAYLLSEAVSRERWEPGTQALEIGCGLGLGGLVGVARGLNVTFSDYDQTPLEFVERSCRENGFDRDRYRTVLLDWEHLPAEQYPVILGADVLYERRLVPLVVNLIARMLAPGGAALLAGPYRVATEDLEPLLTQRSLTWQSQAISATTEHGQAVRGTCYRIRR